MGLLHHLILQQYLSSARSFLHPSNNHLPTQVLGKFDASSPLKEFSFHVRHVSPTREQSEERTGYDQAVNSMRETHRQMGPSASSIEKEDTLRLAWKTLMWWKWDGHQRFVNQVEKERH